MMTVVSTSVSSVHAHDQAGTAWLHIELHRMHQRQAVQCNSSSQPVHASQHLMCTRAPTGAQLCAVKCCCTADNHSPAQFIPLSLAY